MFTYNHQLQIYLGTHIARKYMCVKMTKGCGIGHKYTKYTECLQCKML